MSNQLQQFQFDTTSVRVVTIDNAPWFVAKDVCRALGMCVDSGTYKWTSRLDADERVTHRLPVGIAGRGNPNVTLISESGMYALVMCSDKPEAQRFRKWVTSTVLPAIRKDGAYVMGEEKVATGELSLEEMTLRVINALQTKLAKAEVAKQALVTVARYQTVDSFRAQGKVYLPKKTASALGRLAAKLCRERAIDSNKAAPRAGTIGLSAGSRWVGLRAVRMKGRGWHGRRSSKAEMFAANF